MKQEACIRNCKFNENGRCVLYDIELEKHKVPDPYDAGLVVTWVKCGDCREKEISCAIDNKIRDIYSFYRAFTQEMDIQFNELDKLVCRREDIYK